MPATTYSDEQLLAYLDEQLPVEELAGLEQVMRSSDALRRRTALLARNRDQGAHTVGAIWRRLRLSCLTRSQLGSYLLGVLDRDQTDYVEFHLHTLGCRYCNANLQDLEEHQKTTTESNSRRQRYFESSAGLLRTDERK